MDDASPPPARLTDNAARQSDAVSDDAALFSSRESEVRSYCRAFPAIFSKGRGAIVTDSADREYIDFFAGAGTLNYGHNDPAIKARVIDYLARDGILHALDLHTEAKRDFIRAVEDVLLRPRGLDHKLAFPGPTGTNAVELAMKLARRATGRHTVVAFTNGFHGMTAGSLAASGNRDKRAGAGIDLGGVFRLPYDGYLGPDVDTADLLDRMLDDASSGLDLPAAILVETIQAEGGLQTASAAWLRRLQDAARRHGALFIIDDIQTGCGRTGRFFSFEDMGLTPDVVTLSKSLGGIGLPVALVLVRPEFDVLKPGQHNGTFRGNNLAFVAATAALDYWREPDFQAAVGERIDLVGRRLSEVAARSGAKVMGRGLLQGLRWPDATVADRVSQAAYARGLICETSGAADQVLKLLPPLTVPLDVLAEGLDRIEASVEAVLPSTS